MPFKGRSVSLNGEVKFLGFAGRVPWLALNLLMKSPMSNIEVERRACDPKWFGQAAKSPGMLILCESLQGVDERLCPHLDDHLSQVQPMICPCLGECKEAQRRIEHAHA